MLTSHLPKLSQLKLSLVFIVLLSLCSCNSKELIGPKDTQHAMVTTTIVGEVVDESEKPIEGASVTAHGQSTITDKNGIFFFHNIQAPSDRCFAVVKYNGYFDGVRAEQTRAGEVTRMKLTLGIKETAKLNATQGGLIKIGKASVQFTPNSVVTEVGTPYSGDVTVAYKHLDPDNDKFFDLFPGDFEAIRTDNSSTYLTSYGVLQVELTGSNGEKLNLASGKTATLVYPIPASLASNTPSSIPLWYFDEQLGIWKEEGSATKVGNIYVGTVTHFTPWNLDLSGQIGELNFRVVCNQRPIDNVIVRVGQQKVITSPDGKISITVFADQPVTISILAEDNNGLYSANDVTTQVSLNETKNIGDIYLISGCPSYIIGQLVGCDSHSTSGILYAKYSGGSTFTTTVNGNFTLCIPSNTRSSISASTFNGSFSEEHAIEPLNPDQESSLGSVTACNDDNAKKYFFIPVSGVTDSTGSYVARFSYSGKYIAAIVNEELSPSLNDPILKIFDAKTGSLLYNIKTKGLSEYTGKIWNLSWSGDDTKILVVGISHVKGCITTLIDILKQEDVIIWADSLRSAIFLPITNQVVAIRYAKNVTESIGLYSVAGNLQGTLPVHGPGGMAYPNELLVGGGRLFFTRELQTEVFDLSLNKSILTADVGMATSVSRNGELLCGFWKGGSYSLVNAVNGMLIKQAKGTWSAVSNNQIYISKSLSSDGTTETVALYNVATSDLVKTLDGQLNNVRYNSFDFSEDGNYVLGYHTKGITVWKTK